MQELHMKDPGDRLLGLRLIGAGLIFLLLIWTLIAGPAGAQALGGPRAGVPAAPEPELPATDLLVRFEGPALHFRWSLAPEAALEPDLVRTLRSDALAERARAMREADEAVANPPPGRGPIRTEWVQRWAVEAESDGLLALSARTYSFTGGAHGNLGLGSLLWDRAAGRRLAFAELFADPAAATAALQPQFCKALDVERAARRQGVRNASFSDCPALAELAVVPVGTDRITGVKVLVAPYIAGPWSEGVYEIELDAAAITPFLLPRFASGFAKP